MAETPEEVADGLWLRLGLSGPMRQHLASALRAQYVAGLARAAGAMCWRCAENPQHEDTENCSAFPIRALAEQAKRGDAPRSGIPLLDHAFVPNTWPIRDECDARVSDPGSQVARQCGRPRKEHPAEEVKPEGRK